MKNLKLLCTYVYSHILNLSMSVLLIVMINSTILAPINLQASAKSESTQNIRISGIEVCSFLTKPEMEKIVGLPVLEPKSEQMANLFTCTYADPDFPTVSTIVVISVFEADNKKDAKSIFDLARSNAASVKVVSNLGEEAYWDEILHTLRLLKGKYEIEVEVDSEAGGLDSAIKIAEKILSKL